MKQFVETNERDWLFAPALVGLSYKLIGDFEFWEFLEPIKSRFYRMSPNWSIAIIKATLILVHHREPEWAWKEFLKFWESASDSEKKEAITWVESMLSDVSVGWLIDLYPNIGDFFNDEKEIRKAIRDLCGNLLKPLRDYGISILAKKVNSSVTKDRIHAAICSGLFRESVYRQFDALSEDGCVRVRDLYQYAAISGENCK